MKTKKMLAMLSALTLMTAAFTACENDENSSSEAEIIETSAESSEPESSSAEGSTIYFMSDYDLNPSGGESRSIALTLFEDVYGGRIQWVPTTRNTMYDDLSKAVLGGEKVDMFPYMENAVPYGVSQDLFQPLDDYIDLNSEEWTGIKGLADKMAYGGKHYAVPTEILDPTVLIYSRTAVANLGFDDPYTLYKEGKWTWDTFVEMMKAFDGTGCAGFVGQGIMQSSGQTYVNYDGTAFTSNLDNEALTSAGTVVEQISGAMHDSSFYDTLDDSILFLGMGSWAIPQSNAANPDGDVFFVPFPSADGSGSVVTADINSKMLVKNSDNGKAVATYLACERAAATEEKYVSARKTSAINNGFTDEQYSFLEELKNPDNVMFDFSYGMSSALSWEASDYAARGAINNINDALLAGYSAAPSSWTEIRDSFKNVIDEEISKYN